MIHISLFSGIGGFELAAEWAGWKNYASCEINPFGQKVLNYYWPNAYHHSDVKTFTYEILNTQLIQRFGTDWRNDDIIITGGFPCQPYSAAGKRLGKEDERHLWPEMLRIISEVKPTWVVGENVRGITNWSGGLVFDEVQTDLEALSYEVQPFLLPAAGVNAPHERYRTWFVGYSRTNEYTIRDTQPETVTYSNGNGHKLRRLREDRSETIQSISKQEQRERIWTDNRGISEQGNVADTEKPGCKRSITEGTTSEGGCLMQHPGFDRFPTQSPVRSRNDGISTGLVGITISKHRNESIKAYGNAIVPQVAYKIFKTINDIIQ